MVTVTNAARRHSADAASTGSEALAEIQRRFFLERARVEPSVHVQLTDNWVELTVRFVVPDHGIREVKDQPRTSSPAPARRRVASATLEIVGIPDMHIGLRRARRGTTPRRRRARSHPPLAVAAVVRVPPNTVRLDDTPLLDPASVHALLSPPSTH